MARQQTELKRVGVAENELARQPAVKAAAQGETERGQQFFLDEVRKLNRVLQVETYGGETLADQWIRVHVQRGDLDTEYSVYDLKGEAHRRHPQAYLQVEVWLEEPA